MLAAAVPAAAAATPQQRQFAGYAAATSASLLRQLGDHAGGQVLDSGGLQMLTGLERWAGQHDCESVAASGAEAVGDSGAGSGAGSVAGSLAGSLAEVAADCAIGLAADAVGLGDAVEATRRLRQATYRVGRCGPRRWRVRVRLDWVVAEVAFLTGRPADALTASRRSVLASKRAGAPRHLAKSLLFLGVAELEAAGDGGSPAAVDALRRSATLAETLGLLGLVWPARAVLATALAAGAAASSDGADDGSAARRAAAGDAAAGDAAAGDAAAGDAAAGDAAVRTAAREAQESLETARATVRTIAADLPPALRDAWLCRPDIKGLLS